MSQRYFITGTDTNIGKTTFGCAMLAHFRKNNLSTIGLKPVATGAQLTKHGLRNDDALQLQAQTTIALRYEEINPFVYEPAISPHLALAQTQCSLSVQQVKQQIYNILALSADLILVEGVGGWFCPLNDSETFADLAKSLQLPIILVIGLRLGACNHALLTSYAIQQSGCQFAGWVANCIDPNFDNVDDYIDTFKKLIPTPFLGMIPNYRDQIVIPEQAAAQLNFACI